jgi:TatD DNase family protein
MEEFDPEQDTLISVAQSSGIDTLLLPNVDLTTVERLHNLCDRYPDYAFPMMGFHPTSVDAHYADALVATESYLGKRPYCAIGEIGIDLYWDQTYKKEQIEVFEEQLRWSIDLDLPVAIHTRNAYPEVFNSIHKIGADKLKGVFHSFTGTKEELDEIKKLNTFYIGINGVITFKNSKLSEIVSQMTLDRVVLETDAPYLAPVPYRGRRNEPSYIWKTAEKVALTYQVPIEKVASTTCNNAVKLFKIVKKGA